MLTSTNTKHDKSGIDRLSNERRGEEMTKTEARDMIRRFFYSRLYCSPEVLELAKQTLGEEEAKRVEKQATERRFKE